MNMKTSFESTPGVVVLVATTDRPEPFASLASDLVDAATRVDLPVTIGLVENSRSEASRAANHDTVKRLRAGGLEVLVSDAFPGGHAIGEARTRQRSILGSLVARGRRPSLVWMLDDDVRLCRLVVRDEVLCREPLRDPFGSLLAVGHRTDAPDLLVGTVHGDPPIPAMATWASRMTDLAANLERMIELGPDAIWVSDAATIRRLVEPDYYYDFGQHPEFEEPAYWVPREREQSVFNALRELMAEARYLPCGVGLTRPMVVDGARLQPDEGVARLLGPAQVRGGNAAFFDVDACLAHSYPTAEVAGVCTRRSDSVGLHVLRAARGVRIASSDFAVLHQRDRDAAQLPRNAQEIVRHLLADTFGAALTRAVVGADTEALIEFLRARAERVDRSLSRLRSAIDRVRELARVAPRWVDEAGLRRFVGDPEGALSWFTANVPGLAQGRLPEGARRSMISHAAAGELTRVAAGFSVASTMHLAEFAS